MPSTIGFWHHTAGESLTLKLYPLTAGGIANGAEGDAFSEPDGVNRSAYYEATVAESLSGLYAARVLKGSAVVYSGLVDVPQSGGPFVIDAVVPADVTQILGTSLDESSAGLVAANWQTMFDNAGATSPLVLDDLSGGPGGSVTVGSLSATALAQLAGKRAIFIAVPALIGQELSDPIVQGDSYLADHGRAIEFSREDFPDIPSGSAVTLTARHLDDPQTTFSTIGTVTLPTGVKAVRFELETVQTRDFVPGKYEFDVEVSFPDGNVATFVGPNVYLRVLADVSEN